MFVSQIYKKFACESFQIGSIEVKMEKMLY